MKIRILAFSVVLSPLSLTAQSIDNYEVPLTEWGQPDLQGVWNFVTETPLERPEAFGTREFLTPEEIDQRRARRASQRAEADAREAELVVDPQAPPAGASSTGGYNNFWYERASIGENPRTSLIVYPPDGQIPGLVEGALIHRANLGPDVPGERPVRAIFGGISKDGPEDRGLSERCLVGFNAGPPIGGGGYNANVQIFQHRDHAVIMTEMVHDARIVPLHESEPLDDRIRLWSGNSTGYWDGETLVVETTNFDHLTASYSRFGTARDKTLIERFTRTSPYSIEYQWTLTDPSTFTDRITAIVPMTKVDGQLYEYACHEGNYGMTNILRGERAAERRGMAGENGN